MGATYGFNFHRDTFLGGLKFTLMAWTGPLTGKKQPYAFDQAFAIHLPQPHFNSGSVLIVTANHPKGVEVPIHYTGLNTEVAGLAVADKNEKTTPTSENVTLTPGSTDLTVLFKLPFNIEANAGVPKMGSVTIDYDNTFLELITAGIEDAQIVWTFNSLKTGDTQIAVTTHGGIATFVMTKTYDVRIIVL